MATTDFPVSLLAETAATVRERFSGKVVCKVMPDGDLAPKRSFHVLAEI